MSVKTSTILELEQQGRYSEAGYGRLFAYDSLHINAMVDARKKAKFIRELNPRTHEDTQNGILYSGPTVFYNGNVDPEHEVDKMDLKSAYPAYLINEQIKKPGIFKMRHDGAVPLSDRIALYVLTFNCEMSNMFVKWFLNSSAITMKKIKSDGSRVWGEIGIFSSTDMNLIQYITHFLSEDEGIIKKSYTFHGDAPIEIKKSQIRKLYEMKEEGSTNAKGMLVQSTGWLSIIDKPTYYHMVQYVKFYLLKTVYDYMLQDELIGVQTDCIFYRVTDETMHVPHVISEINLTMSNEQSNIGTYKFQRVKSEEIIANKARVVLKDG